VRWLADALCVGWLTSARFVVGAVRCGASERAVAFVLRSFAVRRWLRVAALYLCLGYREDEIIHYPGPGFRKQGGSPLLHLIFPSLL
jgi:hypothetical protein